MNEEASWRNTVNSEPQPQPHTYVFYNNANKYGILIVFILGWRLDWIKLNCTMISGRTHKRTPISYILIRYVSADLPQLRYHFDGQSFRLSNSSLFKFCLKVFYGTIVIENADYLPKKGESWWVVQRVSLKVQPQIYQWPQHLLCQSYEFTHWCIVGSRIHFTYFP